MKMETLTTVRLILRKFTPDDFSAVHSYASRADNTVYMPWGPNGEEHTREFIRTAIAKAEEVPLAVRQFAVVLKETGCLIGGCTISAAGEKGSLGWIISRDHWNRGYCTELGRALLDFGFGELGLHRIVAVCDAENAASYRVMEKIGMRREGLFLEARPANKNSDKQYGDEYRYAILRDEYESLRGIAYQKTLPVTFDGFIELPELTDGVVRLVCAEKKPADEARKLIPAYDFIITVGSERVGKINLRIGYTDRLYYGGQIGYGVDERHRGNGYAARAVRLLSYVAKAHGMIVLYITNDPSNTASVRVCEKVGAKLLRRCRLPEWHDLYNESRRYVNIFEWILE